MSFAVALVVLQHWAVAVAQEPARGWLWAVPVVIAPAALGPLAQFVEQTDPFD